MNLQSALHHANQAHGSRLDKQGFLYLLHPVSVAFALQEIGENAQVVALLHDVIEDHPDYEKRKEMLVKLSPRQENTLNLVTHYKDLTYREYIYELLNDEDACWVKLADLGHNTSRKRLRPSSDAKMIAEEVVKFQAKNEERNDERYYPYASLVVSALKEYHKQPLDKIERVLYAYDH